jgi:hypothetical protein
LFCTLFLLLPSCHPLLHCSYLLFLILLLVLFCLLFPYSSTVLFGRSSSSSCVKQVCDPHYFLLTDN